MARAAGDEHETIPVIEERPVVLKRRKVSDAVRVRTVVHQDEELVEEPYTVETVEVERVPVDRWVDQPAQVRQEGSTTIIPIHEEVVVVERRLRVAEEVRITRRRTVERTAERVVLRREEAVVERLDAGEAASG